MGGGVNCSTLESQLPVPVIGTDRVKMSSSQGDEQNFLSQEDGYHLRMQRAVLSVEEGGVRRICEPCLGFRQETFLTAQNTLHS